jgi:hypothetical protein
MKHGYAVMISGFVSDTVGEESGVGVYSVGEEKSGGHGHDVVGESAIQRV